MIPERKQFTTIDEYIGTFPEDVRRILEQMRQAIRDAAPDAEETISYRIPAFRQDGILVYFGAFRDHVSFFPTGSGIEAFRKELEPYIGGKGTARFPLDRPVPYDLVKEIVRFRVKENLAKKGPGTGRER
jgi:uncharacterized protein YdhG (YjbR/CyaY superfamily)